MSRSNDSIKEIYNNGMMDERINKLSMKTSSYNRKESITKDSSINNALTCYMKKTNSGISLYTHVYNLLEKFIFERPPNPVLLFEYYSEKLKEQYCNSQYGLSTTLLNNIDYNACKNVTDLFKDIKKSRQRKNGSYINHSGELDATYEYEDGEFVSDFSNQIKNVQELSQSNKVFDKAGYGLTIEEVEIIKATMDELIQSGKIASIRFWGIIFGLKRNYYVLECEWQEEEIERRIQINLDENHKKKITKDYRKIQEVEMFEDEQGIELLMLSNELEDEIYNPEERISKYISKGKSKLANSESLIDDYHHLSYIKELNVQKSTKIKPETLGCGTNKKTYYVSNQPSGEWIELPLLKPHHVVQSRNIKRYFTGNLETPINCYPEFDGLEKHYLRAQIARISAATQISPIGFFIHNKSELTPNILTSLLKKAHSVYHQRILFKSFYGYSANNDYKSLPIYDLFNLVNWVHHIPMINNDGVTEVWLKIQSSIKKNQLFEDEEALIDSYERHNFDSQDTSVDKRLLTPDINTFVGVGPDVFFNLTDDDYVGNLPPWNIELTNKFDHSASFVVVKSNIWPGAVAITRDNILDYTYRGWGVQSDIVYFSPFIPDEYQDECLNCNTIEVKDPTYEDELFVIKEAKLLRQKRLVLNTSTDYVETEERLIQNYSYD
ncbi:radial spoke head protein 4 homolog A-like [Daktulosphaira vitifoliae]|uniref:radial spoke head protein 4 homolog A-like n=1 Tax=Daktulosphaira vitifoliae TaxID=58002 RepID=UPI0021A97D8D|nr:radial spoke head protein 4 homolog A-like [Daktulosphaira vitifoliae]